MIEIGSFPAGSCEGQSRRAFLKAGFSLPLALGLGSELSALAAHDARMKSVLLIWLGGGPSHLDLCDPKPKAPAEYRGPFASIETRTPGVRFSELLPKLAERSDGFSLVRTNVNLYGGHRPAGSVALCGAVASDGGEDVRGKPRTYPPSFGSIIARHRGPQPLPGFISLARGAVGDGVGPCFGQGGGKWGKGYDPFMVSCTDLGEVSVPELRLLDGLSLSRLEHRRSLLGELDEARRRAASIEMAQWSNSYSRAYNLLTSSSAARVFDLSREPEHVRRLYGKTSFGQSCLLGRRLVEAGVPFVQVNWSQYVEVLYNFCDYGWDTHADNFGILADWHGPLLDGVFSTLLDDLRERGLLETTLVICMGEFGRTPRINNIASRDHWPGCYFSMWAGGGIAPGRVVGESDPLGEHPATEPITPDMVGTTILELAGVNAQARAELQVLSGARVIGGLI